MRGAFTELLPLYLTALGCRDDPACPLHATSHMIVLGESQRVVVVLPETLEGDAEGCSEEMPSLSPAAPWVPRCEGSDSRRAHGNAP